MQKVLFGQITGAGISSRAGAYENGTAYFPPYRWWYIYN